MTRMHFRVVASALSQARPRTVPGIHDRTPFESGEVEGWWRSCTAMADALARTNPRFDRETFLIWCSE